MHAAAELVCRRRVVVLVSVKSTRTAVEGRVYTTTAVAQYNGVACKSYTYNRPGLKLSLQPIRP